MGDERKPRTILFFCPGTLCRSPMAAALFRQRLERDPLRRNWRVLSAGLWAVDGEPASPNALQAMAERGIDLSGHIARRVTRDLIAEADLILAMTPHHVEALRLAFPEAADRIHLLATMAGETYGIADPYGLSLPAYRATASELERLISAGYDRIVALAEGTREPAVSSTFRAP